MSMSSNTTDLTDALWLRSICFRLLRTPLRTTVLGCGLAITVCLSCLARADDPKVDLRPESKLSPKERRFFKGIEKKLISKPKSKDDPEDLNTWYVLLFWEVAKGARQSVRDTADYRITTLEIQGAQQQDAKLVQGRSEAAIAVVAFYESANSAAAKLQPTQGGVTQGAQLIGSKDWRFKAFRDEDKARQFFEMVRPKTVAEK